MIRSGLPIDPVLPEIVETLKQHNSLLLSAEPGAGKSTVVPLALLESDLAQGRKIRMLEPRVLAARAAAKRMAHNLGEKPGETVGYRTRLETCCSARTKIEVVTEAILTKMLQRDPALEDTGIVIFDEFHERSIHADLALALALDARSAFRDDLKIVVMSATLETESLKKLLGNPPEIHSKGNCYPVREMYSSEHQALPLEQRIFHAVNSALKAFPGDVLVFLPGEYEIRKALALLSGGNGMEVLPLCGALGSAEQDKVFTPHPEHIRRVILATSIAETSITIPGVKIVIDSGLMRVPRFSPAAGMNHLETLKVTKAGAEQRKGRAGRTSPGVCIRLWSGFEQNQLLPFPQPEILSSDLAPAMLELVKWGCREQNVAAMPWVDTPPVPMTSQAFRLLEGIGALKRTDGTITEHGEKILALPMHPRLAHAVLKGAELGAGGTAADIAAVLEDHDLTGTDLRERLNKVRRNSPDTALIRKNAARIRSLLSASGAGQHDLTGVLTAAAYPDRIGRSREAFSGEYILSNGVTAYLPKTDPLAGCEFLAVAETSSMNGRTTIRLAAETNLAELEEYLPEIFEEKEELNWDEERSIVTREKVLRIGSVAVKRTPLSGKPADELLIPMLLKAIRSAGYRKAFEPAPGTENFRERVQFLHIHETSGEFPDSSEEGLLADMENWLAPYLSGVNSFAGLRKLDLRSLLESRVPRNAVFRMASLAPEKLEVPSGSRIRISYEDPMQPQASVKLQELFGMLKTPLLGGNKVPLLLDILSPAQRTVQKTSDLDSFWHESYFLVRKDMRGRYPKHDWPEDPLNATARRGVKKR